MSGAPETRAETPAEKAEKARVRRRWLTLGEVLAVVAALISGLTLWNSWQQRSDEQAKEVRAEKKAESAAATIVLGAAGEDEGRRLKLASLRADQNVQGQTILFPPALKVAAVETTGDPRIEADWIQDALRDATTGEKDRGDARLPLLIVTRYWSDGAVRTARAYYDLGYTLEEGGLLGGRKLRLKGLSLIGAAPEKADPERLDKLWAARR
ncbi:hypothetical protein [Sphingomonas jatrophae]|uniref:Uncharacterized protein n=1 Tax=Sphingomonas jatrophae TaxID=1166337 RepID=A0A1I6L558_9SPHN|nr:hypothetical protein [Sphingomonas jatrophae]SFR98599.1 hypothetical protein SAMN05192580_2308 [Sphingomonas jatrophae]